MRLRDARPARTSGPVALTVGSASYRVQPDARTFWAVLDGEDIALVLDADGSVRAFAEGGELRLTEFEAAVIRATCFRVPLTAELVTS